MPPRGIYQRGQFVIGATYSADKVAMEETRKATIRRGAFMTSDPVITKRAPLPEDLAEFEAANQAAGPDPFEQQRLAIAEITRRLEAVREQLKTTKAKAKRK
jgi:hypothetical protein